MLQSKNRKDTLFSRDHPLKKVGGPCLEPSLATTETGQMGIICVKKGYDKLLAKGTRCFVGAGVCEILSNSLHCLRPMRRGKDKFFCQRDFDWRSSYEHCVRALGKHH